MELTKKIIPNFLSDGGEMGKLIRAMDWSNSPLGNPGQWPQVLRTSVSICLNSHFPILFVRAKVFHGILDKNAERSAQAGISQFSFLSKLYFPGQHRCIACRQYLSASRCYT